MSGSLPFTIASLREVYASGGVTPEEVAREALRRARSSAHPNVWITLLSEDEVLEHARRLDSTRRAQLPLFGVPFAIKDNIDLAGVATTCACPAFARVPERSATVVERLIAAGAIPIGKTNLDQFATGLVGTRTPFGACSSVFHRDYISGGSSSGSAVAVAAGTVAFALGTDTAGSGRVPAAFNHIVGWKPTRGLLSTRGVFPACRSLDCVSVFAGSCGDAAAVMQIAAGPDEEDPYSRGGRAADWRTRPRVGIPASDTLEFFGDTAARELYAAAITQLAALDVEIVEVDFGPFRRAAELLYAGPWVAERRWALGEFLNARGSEMDPTVHAIISSAERYSAVDAFDAAYRLEGLRRAADNEWAKMDALLLPTTGTTYTIQQVQADPVQLNTNLGYYTNFVNLLDLSCVAIPAGFRGNGLPFGVTLMSRAFTDSALLALGDRLHRRLASEIGRAGIALNTQPAVKAPPSGEIQLAVVGAHLSGQPLNWQLTQRGARLVQSTRTARNYRLFALANTTPPKPGLVRVDEPASDGIEVEVWALGPEAFGSFVAEVPPPLGVGNAVLADGSTVKSFICEPAALAGAMDITSYGGWRAYLRR